MSALLTDEQRLDWLQLIRSENVGPRTFRALINKFGGARAALEGLPDLLRHATGARAIRLFSRDDAAREMDAARKMGVVFVALGEAHYPAALRAIDAAPPLLAVKGDLASLARPCAAIVGSRNASAAGLAFAEKLARSLSAERIVVVSGLARGVDAAAHRASLAHGTIAALAGGHARLYPSEHADLAAQICERGALVSEMPLEWEPRGRDFPRRNRIVSGLSLASVVVEAARRSGSLITARFAAEQGREVFAVPGSPLDPRAEGTNDLLREGAQFCTRPEDVIAALAPLIEGAAPRADLFQETAPAHETEPLWEESDLFGAAQPSPRTAPDHEMDEERAAYAPAVDDQDARAMIAAMLGPTPIAVDDLARAARLPAPAVLTALVELEMAGLTERHAGGRFSAARPRS
ncbi:MAG: DNA-processing protein DprA [Hyphomicrobiales bacterium]|nr:DNA-processing protein DprA [Hyphomicrobiales bacterium]